MTNKPTMNNELMESHYNVINLLKENFPELYNWLLPICPESHIEKYVRGVNYFKDDNHIKLVLYTDNYEYWIKAIRSNKKISYLGAIVNCRKSRTGEDWKRGRDLPDGIYCENTWNQILRAIIRYELKELEIK